jgi:hypothetical protein
MQFLTCYFLLKQSGPSNMPSLLASAGASCRSHQANAKKRSPDCAKTSKDNKITGQLRSLQPPMVPNEARLAKALPAKKLPMT